MSEDWRGDEPELRDLFAIAALQSPHFFARVGEVPNFETRMAAQAYRVADAMLEARYMSRDELEAAR